jgi:HAD superfamily hydrolase (TIGR01490 family)
VKDHKPLVVFDLDGTLTKKDTYIPFLLGFLLRNPWRVLRTIHLPLAVLVHLFGLRNNTWLKLIFLKAFLGGVNRNKIESWVNKFSDNVVDNGMRENALDILAKHQRQHAEIVLVSASLDIYVEAIGGKLGFINIISTKAEFKQNCVTGNITTQNCYGEEKVERITEWLMHHDHDHVDIAYSDHHSDLPILQLAKKGIAVNPTNNLRALSKSKQLEVVDW